MGQVDARTFEQAVAALAKFTSEEPVGPLPHQQWSDLYSETGPDGVGAMGSEPSCDVLAVKASYGNNKLPCVVSSDQTFTGQQAADLMGAWLECLVELTQTTAFTRVKELDSEQGPHGIYSARILDYHSDYKPCRWTPFWSRISH